MSRATNDLNAVRGMIGPAVMYTSNTVLTFIVAIALMASIDLRLTLMALIPLPFVSISVRYFGAAIHRRFEHIQQELSEISAITQETLSGVRVVRAYGQEAFEIERFRQANENICSGTGGSFACRASTTRVWAFSWAWARCSSSGWAAARSCRGA